MGNNNSILNINDEDVPFYNNIRLDKVEGKIIKVLDINKFIIIIKHNYEYKKFLCKGYGYQIINNDEKEFSLAKLNSILNSIYPVLSITTFGTDENGYLLVKIESLNLKTNVNNIMLQQKNIKPEINYNYKKDKM